MRFREPSEREKEFYKQYIDRLSAVLQTIIVLFLVLLMGLSWYAIDGIVAKVIATLVIGVVGKKPFENALQMNIGNKYYKEGNYQVAEIDIDSKNYRNMTIGGSTYSKIFTYKVPEIDRDIIVNRKSQQKILHDKKAILIKMRFLDKTSYYITECV